MLRISGWVYCIYCCQLIQADEAAVTFRTGFFRLVYPLARCHCCAVSSSEREATSNGMAS